MPDAQKYQGLLMRLSGKVALITGASRGIGESIARGFHREGAYVVLTDIRDDLGRAVVDELGQRTHYLRLDVRDESEWEQVVNNVVRGCGSLDILVNNAGITGFEDDAALHNPEHASLEAWRSVHATNLDGVFLGCKYGIRAMRARGSGSIINIGSLSGVVGIPGGAAYASSKAAVRNHTKSVALYCAEQGLQIRCNVIQPAAILTPLWDSLLGHGPDRLERMAEYVRDTPLGRFGSADEVAALAVYLAADESAYMTGAELNLDGGILAGAIATPSSLRCDAS